MPKPAAIARVHSGPRTGPRRRFRVTWLEPRAAVFGTEIVETASPIAAITQARRHPILTAIRGTASPAIISPRLKDERLTPNAKPCLFPDTPCAISAFVAGCAMPLATPPNAKNPASVVHDLAGPAIPSMQIASITPATYTARRTPMISTSLPPGMAAAAEHATKTTPARPTALTPKSRSSRMSTASPPVRKSGSVANEATVVALTVTHVSPNRSDRAFIRIPLPGLQRETRSVDGGHAVELRSAV